MNHRPQKLHPPSNDAGRQMPKFLPGDPVVAIDDDSTGRVEYARHDGQVCVVWDHSSRREWVHEDSIRWPPSFQPTRRG